MCGILMGWLNVVAQGRFSGRLVSKQDEARLVEECQRLGPLLGGSTGGNPERERTQLSQIVRAIASGEVRDYLQQRAENQEARLLPFTCYHMHRECHSDQDLQCNRRV